MFLEGSDALSSQGAGAQRLQKFCDLLHARTQYEKQQPHFSLWSNLMRGKFIGSTTPANLWQKFSVTRILTRDLFVVVKHLVKHSMGRYKPTWEILPLMVTSAVACERQNTKLNLNHGDTNAESNEYWRVLDDFLFYHLLAVLHSRSNKNATAISNRKLLSISIKLGVSDKYLTMWLKSYPLHFTEEWWNNTRSTGDT